jgi:hypothetical protein
MKNLYLCLKINSKENVQDKIFQILHIYLMQEQIWLFLISVCNLTVCSCIETTKIYTECRKINSVLALINVLTFRCCKHSTVQFKCQVEDRIFQFCGKECTFKEMSLLSAKVNSYSIFLHFLSHNKGSSVSELHNTQHTWAMVAELQASSISGKSEMSINQNMRPRWPSMRGTVEATSASTATRLWFAHEKIRDLSYY